MSEEFIKAMKKFGFDEKGAQELEDVLDGRASGKSPEPTASTLRKFGFDEASAERTAYSLIGAARRRLREMKHG